MRTTKISIAIDRDQLRLSRLAAESEGVSLSAYIGRALGHQLEEQERVDAARKLHATWSAESMPTAKDREAFLARMARPRKSRKKVA